MMRSKVRARSPGVEIGAFGVGRVAVLGGKALFCLPNGSVLPLYVFWCIWHVLCPRYVFSLYFVCILCIWVYRRGSTCIPCGFALRPQDPYLNAYAIHMKDTFFSIHSGYIHDTNVFRCILRDTLDTHRIQDWILYLPLGARIRPRYSEDARICPLAAHVSQDTA